MDNRDRGTFEEGAHPPDQETLMDEPKGLPETHGYATAAWNAGQVTGKIVERTGPLLNLPPRFEPLDKPFPLLARLGIGVTQPKTGGR